ncbi:MAG: tetratricopeptide repeat protein, partial [Saprospiraceae bacterium]|nr:tetratricopeptide repeat protein [Saprospiraceae bacterium]
MKLQNSGAQPLSNVKISAFGAGSVFSNDNGMYEMVFSGKSPGSSVSLLVTFDGHEVINNKELERCVIRQNPDDLVFIVMAKQGQRNQQALAYYDIIVTNTNANYSKELNNIKSRLDNLDEDDKDRQVLREQIAALQAEKESLLERAEDLAKQLATVDLDRSSKIANEAYQKFQEGDVKAALLVLDEESLEKSLMESQAEVNILQEKLMKADSALSQSIENFMIKARFCISDRQYDLAYKNYYRAIQADSTNVENLWELADYCSNMNMQKRAIRFYNLALENTTSITSKIQLLNRLSNQYGYDDKLSEAEASLTLSSAMMDQLKIEQPESYYEYLASTKNSWGDYYMSVRDYPQAEKALLTSYEIYDSLTGVNPEKFEPKLADLTRNVASMYRLQMKYTDVESYFMRALEIYNRLAVDDPLTYEVKIALTQELLGNLYFDLDNFPKGEEMLKKALVTYDKLAKKNPKSYEYYRSDILSRLFVGYSKNREIEKAETAIMEVLEIVTRLAEDNPDRYDGNLATVYSDIAILKWNQGKIPEANEQLQKAVSIAKSLAKLSPEKYQVMVARMQSNLAFTYNAMNDYEAADLNFQEVLDIYRPLVEKDPQTFKIRMCYPLVNIAGLNQSLLRKHLDRKFQDQGILALQEAKKLLSGYDTTMRDVKALNAEISRLNEYFVNVTDEDLMVQGEINRVLELGERKRETSDSTLIESLQKESIEIVVQGLSDYSENATMREFGAEFYGNLSWSYLVKKQFLLAEIAASSGYELDSRQE